MVKIGVGLSPNKANFGPILFSGELIRAFEQVKRLGYKGVELGLLDSATIDQDEILRALDKYDLQAYGIGTGQTYITDGFSLYNADDRNRQKAVERIRGHIDFSVKLGCYVIIGGIRGRINASGDEFIQQKELGNQAVRACVEYAQDKGVDLLLEPINRYESNIINTLEEGLELIVDIGSSNLKLLPDTFHMNIEERFIEGSILKTGSHIGYIHFADSNRHAPGLGHINFSQVISALKMIEFDGVIGIEILPKPNDYQAARQAIQYVNSLIKGVAID